MAAWHPPDHRPQEPWPIDDRRHSLIHERVRFDEVQRIIRKLIGGCIFFQGGWASTATWPKRGKKKRGFFFMPYGTFFEWITSLSILHEEKCAVGWEEEVEQCWMPPNKMWLNFLQATSSYFGGASDWAVQPWLGAIWLPLKSTNKPHK